MDSKVDDFFNKMLYFFPLKNEDYRNMVEKYGEVLETVIIEDVFMPEIISLLSEDKDIALLREIFDYFEKIVCYEDDDLNNIFSVTVLEILGNDREILERAKKYMGVKTSYLQVESDKDLGRI